MSGSLPDLFAKCSCSGGTICRYCLQLTAFVIAGVFGALVAWKPRKSIEIQISLYRPFNWKLEPISMEKAVKKTRRMGLTLLVLGVAAFVYIWLAPK